MLGCSRWTLRSVLHGAPLSWRFIQALSGMPKREWFYLPAEQRFERVRARIAEWHAQPRPPGWGLGRRYIEERQSKGQKGGRSHGKGG
jgi:hypothetical protein